MDIKIQTKLFDCDTVTILFSSEKVPHLSLPMEDAVKLRNLLLKEIPSAKYEIMEIELKHAKAELERLYDKEYLQMIGF